MEGFTVNFFDSFKVEHLVFVSRLKVESFNIAEPKLVLSRAVNALDFLFVVVRLANRSDRIVEELYHVYITLDVSIKESLVLFIPVATCRDV